MPSCSSRTSISIGQLLGNNSLSHKFQPIVNLNDNRYLGYEALLRAEHFDPVTLFELAETEGRKYELDLFSIHQSTQSFFHSILKDCPEYLLFVNVFPSTLIRSYLATGLHEFILDHVPPRRVVFEISEAEHIRDLNQFGIIVRELKALGYQFAVDDMGKGVSTIAAITTMQPAFIKLDKWFSDDLSKNRHKQDCIQRMLRFGGAEFRIILEGIETVEDLAVAKSLGIEFVQGFCLGMPEALDYHLHH